VGYQAEPSIQDQVSLKASAVCAGRPRDTPPLFTGLIEFKYRFLFSSIYFGFSGFTQHTLGTTSGQIGGLRVNIAALTRFDTPLL
jgi:hypothetical protein